MTFIKSTEIILKQNGNLPMTSRQIWDKIKQQNLINTKGKTPWASLNTILLLNSTNSNVKKRSGSFFEIVETNPNKFRILDYNPGYTNIEDKELIENNTAPILLYQITSKSIGWKTLSIFNHEENIEYEISNCDEYTYIMKDDAHDTIKIGKTKNDPEIRFNQFRTANPSIKLMHVFPSSLYSESDLHNKFDDSQKDLEWFYNTKEVRTFLTEELKKHDSVMKSYLKRQELNSIESNMIMIL